MATNSQATSAEVHGAGAAAPAPSPSRMWPTRPGPRPGLSLADEAARFNHWLGQRVQIGTILRAESPPLAAHSGRCGRVVATHFAGVYVALDPALRERTHKRVLVLLERSGGVDDSVLTPLGEPSPAEMPCMYIGAVE